MGHILLMNVDELPGVKLAGLLRSQHHSVAVLSVGASLATALRQESPVPDLVILDPSQREKYAGTLLDEIVSYRTRYGPQPMLLCVLRVYRGPQPELDLEKKGARVVYV